MSMETRPGAPQAGHGPGYERTDADVRSLLKFGAALFVILVAVLISMKWMFSYYAKSQPLGPPASPFESARVLPPQPRLQVAPHLDLQAYCAAQLEDLESYGWVDQHNQIVHIPVDRAMDVILQRGLPTRPAATETTGGTAAADSTATPSVPAANELQGQCGYLAKPPAAEEK